jgi:hypothetical protein
MGFQRKFLINIADGRVLYYIPGKMIVITKHYNKRLYIILRTL